MPDRLPPHAIAIVGMAGRFPAARSVAELWRLLDEGREATSWPSDAQLLAAGESRGALADPNYVKAALVLPDMEAFDAGFFGFTPREGAILDPQHRHFLEACWEALEDAGHAPSRFKGAVGVFGGCGMQAYMARNLLSNPKLVDEIGLFLLRHTGNDKDFLTTRVSYLFNLSGPSVGVQTACSTSLVAVHVACQSLLSGECDMALAGGVSIEVPHGRGYRYAEGEILSSDGHCRAFDDDADGTLFGSGAGVVVLRRLDDALADGDQIYAVIRGSAVNNDGAAKAGYLAPSVDGQSRAAAEALVVAEADPASIGFIEAHGTGTRVGDPIELTALQSAYRGARDIAIGSVKTNIGHLDTAAGVASLIKAALCLKHETIAPSLNFSRPNTRFAFGESPFRVAAQKRAWPRGETRRRAAVNSLGVGGTNAHVILEEAPPRPASPASAIPQLVPLSAKTPQALEALTAKWRDFLAAPPPDLNLRDAAFTMQEGRERFAHRRCLVGRTPEALRASLANAQAGEAKAPAPKVVFMFPGGGAQYPGAGKRLYESEPAFRAAVEECFAAMPAGAPKDLRALMFARGAEDAEACAALEQPMQSLLSVFVIEYALARMWRAWGVRPAAVIGHSAGEYAAAAITGVMTLADALATVALRGEIFAAAPAGGMVSVRAPEAWVRAHMGEELDLAVLNAPGLCVVSGAEEALAAFVERAAVAGVECARVRINVAAHSRMLDAGLARFRAHLERVRLSVPDAPFISNLTGDWADPAALTSADYWVRHLRETVRFSDGLRTAARDGDAILLEVGPGRALSALAEMQSLARPPRAIAATLPGADQKICDHTAALEAAGALWAHGVEIEFTRLRGEGPARRVSLPTYAFERTRCWIEPGLGAAASAQDSAPALGFTRTSALERWFYEPRWEIAPLAAPTLRAGEEWLVFADDGALSRAFVDLLRERGAQPYVVQIGPRFARIGERRFAMRPGAAKDFALLFDALDGVSRAPTRIAHLWSLNAPKPDIGAVAAPLVFDSAFHLAHELALRGWSPARIVFATAGAFGVDDEGPRRPDRAALLGPALVLPRELPGVDARVVDFEAEHEARAQALIDECLAQDACAVVAHRGGRRRVRAHALMRNAPAPRRRLRERGIYLITGGLGGVGLELARHLAAAHHARLALTSRAPFPARAEWAEIAASPEGGERARRVRAVMELERLGGDVLVVQADIAKVDEAAAAIRETRAHFGGLNGVFHAAGALDDGLAATKSLEAAHALMAPKQAGAFILDALLPAGALDVFGVFSSTSAVYGPPGQIDYAAANAVVESLAAARPDGVAIAWGVWADVGMAARLDAPPLGRSVHPLLGAHAQDGETHHFIARCRASEAWALMEHRIGETAILPGAAYLEMAAAAAAALGCESLDIENASFIAPMAFAGDGARTVRTTMRPAGAHAWRCEVESRRNAGETWTPHFEAKLKRAAARPGKLSKPVFPLAPVPAERLTLSERGIGFGPRWACLESAARFGGDASALVRLPSAFSGDLKLYRLHPALLDVASTVGLFCMHQEGEGVFAPISLDAMRVFAPLPAEIQVAAKLVEERADDVSFDVELADRRGRLVATLRGFTLRRIDPSLAAHAAAAPAPLEVAAKPLARLLAAGIRADDAPALFKRALEGPPLQVITSIPLEELDASVGADGAAATRAETPGAAPQDEGLEARIGRMCGELLGVPAIGAEDNFLEFGGGSLTGVRLFARIRKELGVDLSLNALFQAPTVGALAALVRSLKPELGGADAPSAPAAIARAWSPLVCIRKGDQARRRPIFCVHGAGGNVVRFKPLADRLAREVPFYGLQMQGVDGRLPFQETIEEMAESYLAAVRTVDPNGPYRLAGYSGGGMIAFEMAQRIVREGGEVELLAFFDTLAPAAARTQARWGEKLRLIGRMDRRYLLNWPREALRNKLNSWRLRLAERGVLAGAASHLEIVGRHATHAFIRAQARYDPAPYPGRVTLFRAACASMWFLRAGPLLGWDDLVAGVDLHVLDAFHDTVFEPPSIDDMAQIMEQRLAALDGLSAARAATAA